MSNVLVTGAGGAATPSMIRDLRSAGHYVVACDMDPYAAGFWVADAAYCIPGGADARFPEALRDIGENERIDVLVPLVDEELLPCWDADLPCEILTPRRAFIETCLRKDRLMVAMAAKGLPVPHTKSAADWRHWPDQPTVLKPRVGRGSRGLAILRDKAELTAAMERLDRPAEDMLLQSQIQGTEYTVSVVVWRDGRVLSVVPKQILCKRGITRQAVTQRVPAITAVCCRIQEAFRADGPFNVQLMLAADDRPWIFEINPRYSSTTSLTVAAGCPEVTGLVDEAVHGPAPSQGYDDWRAGTHLVRGTLDSFFPEFSYRKRLPQHA